MRIKDPQDRPQRPQLNPEHPIWVTYWVTESGNLEWSECFIESRNINSLKKLTKTVMRKWLRRPVRVLYSGPVIGYNEQYEGFAEVVKLESEGLAAVVYANPQEYQI
jgi:hypothetical protein